MRGVQLLAAWMGVSHSCGGGGACNERGGDLNVGFRLLATSKLFSKGKERKLTVCERQKEPQRSYKNVSPTMKTHGVDKKTQVSR